MQLEEYYKMRELEDFHWWYCATHKAIMRELEKLPENSMILDVGCGTGRLMEILNSIGFRAYGVDISCKALQLASSRELNKGRLFQGLPEKLFFKDGQFDAAMCIDVLYHKKVNVAGSLSEIYRSLKKNGILILQTPAFEFLRGGHDDVVETARRYTKNDVRELLKKTGFKKVSVWYRNTWLFFAFFLWRKILNKKNKSDLRAAPKVLNEIFYRLSLLDNYLSKFISLPVGTSVFCVAIK